MKNPFREVSKKNPEWICDICGHAWSSQNGRDCSICGDGSKVKYGGKLDWRRQMKTPPNRSLS